MRHLSAFIETVRCGSLKAASERIFLTQPAISKTLKDLENILGVALMHRDRSGIELTREGAVFQQFAEQALAALGHGLASLDALSAGTAAPLRVGALPSVAADLLPDVIMQFAEFSPATPVMVEDGPIEGLIDRLRAGALDLIVGRMGPPERMVGLSFTPLYAEQVVFAVAADHPLAAADTPEMLASACVLYPPKGAAICSAVDRFLLSQGGADWPKRIETVSGAFGRAMTLGPAQAVWIISQGVVARDIAAGRMVRLPIDTSTMAGHVGIMARSEEDPTPPMRLFRQALLEPRTATAFAHDRPR
ncbi:LysR family transcriptional regulator, pca operon transcriptional activator [Sulfitobacter brevis]|uniref:LysR family transcriptional regulator, pca operon transcriptional activator n=1 Tax=Sulfitobacter brevis TaxID=74348 RepID=A0A1I2ETR3_9RHOB|nr:pca operon transcription factor PcaQ [Sulfitobacter brevis]SFE96524.1 LysR family transcriptional regulator, pca operon transcriptional activator [Sulfitobacter brevis]